MKISGWIRDGSFEIVIDFRGTSSPVSSSGVSSDTQSDGDRGVELSEERVEKDPPVPDGPKQDNAIRKVYRKDFDKAILEMEAAGREITPDAVVVWLGGAHMDHHDWTWIRIKEAVASHMIRRERQKEAPHREGDVRNEILQAVQELQAAKRSVSVYSVSKHLGRGNLSSQEKKGLLIRGVMDDLGLPKSKRGRKPKTPAPADKNVRILPVTGGNLICPKDGSDHIMEVCNVQGIGGLVCPSFIKRDVDSNGNGNLYCSLPLDQEVR